MSKNNSETVTISKAEYEYLTGLKDLEKHCAQLESELNWLKEQLQIAGGYREQKHRDHGRTV